MRHIFHYEHETKFLIKKRDFILGAQKVYTRKMSKCFGALSPYVWQCSEYTSRTSLRGFMRLSFRATGIKGVFKKRPNVGYKDSILQHFKHCPLQSSPLYWRYTVPNVSSVVGMLPGTHSL